MVDPIIFIIITILGASLGIKVTSTQNPVYSGLYLVLLFFLGSGIGFLLGLEFIGLLFLLVYAGAIAVLVLFVVMMLDVKAIENPWSAKKKRLFFFVGLGFLFCLLCIGWSENLQQSIKSFATTCIGTLVLFSAMTYEDSIKKKFQPIILREDKFLNTEVTKRFQDLLDGRIESWHHLCDSEGLTEFFRLSFNKENMDTSYGINHMWFVDFDTSCALNDPSYLLYSTYAILLIIAGVILLIAMVGAITLTLQKNCPESLYRQLGRESKNAVFLIKEKIPTRTLLDSTCNASP
uniref:NADH-ubiquinone oxidoreductase chain 6 n=1 Tax=Setoutiphycus delamareoides TaxID=2849225 RepID=A0A8D5ZBT6_9PHAE|nr:NADH dehydrogenase subunit 6 [Setoutiphycus delamareoides]